MLFLDGAFVCPILAVFVSAEIRVQTVLGSIGRRMGTSDSRVVKKLIRLDISTS